MPSMEIRVGLCGFTMSMAAYSRYFPVVEVDGVKQEVRSTTIILADQPGIIIVVRYLCKFSLFGLRLDISSS